MVQVGTVTEMSFADGGIVNLNVKWQFERAFEGWIEAKDYADSLALENEHVRIVERTP